MRQLICHANNGPSHISPPGPLLAAITDWSQGPVLVAKSGPQGPLMAAKTGPPMPKEVSIPVGTTFGNQMWSPQLQ